MPALVAVGVFVAVAIGVFAVASLLDQRSARARLIKERLSTAEKPAERKPEEELALLRDQTLSEIPALDSLLRRSARISNLQILLAQADLDMRAGNFLGLCLLTGVGIGLIVLFATVNPLFAWLGFLVGAILPYSFVTYRRSKRFHDFEELFPEAIDTLARAVRAGQPAIFIYPVASPAKCGRSREE